MQSRFGTISSGPFFPGSEGTKFEKWFGKAEFADSNVNDPIKYLWEEKAPQGFSFIS